MKTLATILLCSITVLVQSQISSDIEILSDSESTLSTTVSNSATSSPTTTIGNTITNTEIKFDFDESRALTEINSKKNCEAYPWISSDGLRLYYTQEKGKIDLIMYSERPNTYSKFESPTALSINSEVNDNMSPWLSEDELTIFFIVRKNHGTFQNTLCRATRLTINESFDTPVKVNLLGDASGFISSPSFTQDLEQLYLYNSTNKNKIIIFEKIDDNNYTVKNSIQVPRGYVFGPGKIGGDDLKYYVPMQNKMNYVEQMYVYTRENTEASFHSPTLLINDSFKAAKNLSQPSISSNGNFFVFTTSPQNSWSSNDLFILQKDIPRPTQAEIAIETAKNTTGKVIVYPNPVTNYVNIRLDNNYDPSQTNYSIYTLDGTLIENNSFARHNHEVRISTQQYASGLYILKVTATNMTVITRKFVVRR